jgi:hypothetical protein
VRAHLPSQEHRPVTSNRSAMCRRCLASPPAHRYWRGRRQHGRRYSGRGLLPFHGWSGRERVDSTRVDYNLSNNDKMFFRFRCGLYFQDEYRVNSSLKLTLALRADRNSDGSSPDSVPTPITCSTTPTSQTRLLTSAVERSVRFSPLCRSRPTPMDRLCRRPSPGAYFNFKLG